MQLCSKSSHTCYIESTLAVTESPLLPCCKKTLHFSHKTFLWIYSDYQTSCDYFPKQHRPIGFCHEAAVLFLLVGTELVNIV